MKKTIILLTALLTTFVSFAQQGINYKAIIKDDFGNVIVNTNVVVLFTIYEGAALTNDVYVEQHAYTTDSNGLVILNIGDGNTADNFNTINWGIDEHFLNVQVNIDGAGLEDMGTTQFMAVPYAKTAETAANIFSGDYNDLSNQPTLPAGLEKITESNGSSDNTGWRLIGREPNNYGPIGSLAVDLSTNDGVSIVNGATGPFSMAMGRGTTASGTSSTAMGTGTWAAGSASTAMGGITTASETFSTTMGNFTIASGRASTAMGVNTTAESYVSLVIGRYNTGGGNPTGWATSDPLFEIGNGESTVSKNNALTVLKNGKTGVNTSNPLSMFEVAHETGNPSVSNLTNALSIRNIDTATSWQFYSQFNNDLHLYNNGVYRGAFLGLSGAYAQTSDRRLKKDITPLNNKTLDKVMQLNPVSYLMKDQKDTKRNLGLISQEVQEIFPNIAYYIEGADVLSLSYTELIPVLIKATQEQQEIIEEQNKNIEKLIQRLEALENKNN